MTIAFIEQRIDGIAESTFDFSDFGQPIGAYVYGIRKFCLSGPPGGAALQQIGISYAPADGTGVGYSKVTLKQQVSEKMDLGNTYAYVGVLAFLGGSTPQHVLLGNEQGMSLGVSGGPVTPLNPPALSCAVLGGFNLIGVKDGARYSGIGAATGLTCWPGMGATADLAPVCTGELLGDTAFGGTVDVGHVIADAAQPGIVAMPVWTQSPSATFSIPFTGRISGAAIFVQSFFAMLDVTRTIDPGQLPYFESLTVGADDIVIDPKNATVSCSFGVDYQANTDNETPVFPRTAGSAIVIGLA